MEEKWLLIRFTTATPKWLLMLYYFSLYRVYFRNWGSGFSVWWLVIQGCYKAAEADSLSEGYFCISLVMKSLAGFDRLLKPVFR